MEREASFVFLSLFFFFFIDYMTTVGSFPLSL